MSNSEMRTKCCDVVIGPEHRYCPRCGWEAHVEEPHEPLSATRIARDESAAQKEHSPTVRPLRVEEAREQVERAADKLLSMHEATQAKGWTEFIAALNVLTDAIRAEGEQQAAAAMFDADERDALKAQIAALTAEIEQHRQRGIELQIVADARAKGELEQMRRAASAERDRDQLLSAREDAKAFGTGI